MIRLSLILLCGLFAAMLIWGTDSGEQQVAAIEEAVLEQPTPVVQAEVVEETPELIVVPEPIAEVVEAEVEELVETTKLETLDLTQPPKPNSLLVVQSSDAPAGEPLLAAVTAAVTEAVTETPANPNAPAKLLVVTGNSVNMRAGPSTSQSIVGNLKRGDRAELVAEAADGWLQIRSVASGRTGFMAGRFLDPVTQ